MKKTEYQNLTPIGKQIFSELYKPNKRDRYKISFTQRQLELMSFACELAIEDRKLNDEKTLVSILQKIDNLKIPKFQKHYE
tara:strand:+ start:1004 stop:1246 length:243 start_codon:yes stop_codon:yes gene_type:complete